MARTPPDFARNPSCGVAYMAAAVLGLPLLDGLRAVYGCFFLTRLPRFTHPTSHTLRL
jgi:hypothetical protein